MRNLQRRTALWPEQTPVHREADVTRYANAEESSWSTTSRPKGWKSATLVEEFVSITLRDARLEAPLTRRLSLSVVGQNLFDPAHAEYAGEGEIVTTTLVPRSASINLCLDATTMKEDGP